MLPQQRCKRTDVCQGENMLTVAFLYLASPQLKPGRATKQRVTWKTCRGVPSPARRRTAP